MSSPTEFLPSNGVAASGHGDGGGDGDAAAGVVYTDRADTAALAVDTIANRRDGNGNDSYSCDDSGSDGGGSPYVGAASTDGSLTTRSSRSRSRSMPLPPTRSRLTPRRSELPRRTRSVSPLRSGLPSWYHLRPQSPRRHARWRRRETVRCPNSNANQAASYASGEVVSSAIVGGVTAVVEAGGRAPLLAVKRRRSVETRRARSTHASEVKRGVGRSASRLTGRVTKSRPRSRSTMRPHSRSNLASISVSRSVADSRKLAKAVKRSKTCPAPVLLSAASSSQVSSRSLSTDKKIRRLPAPSYSPWLQTRRMANGLASEPARFETAADTAMPVLTPNRPNVVGAVTTSFDNATAEKELLMLQLVRTQRELDVLQQELERLESVAAKRVSVGSKSSRPSEADVAKTRDVGPVPELPSTLMHDPTFRNIIQRHATHLKQEKQRLAELIARRDRKAQRRSDDRVV